MMNIMFYIQQVIIVMSVLSMPVIDIMGLFCYPFLKLFSIIKNKKHMENTFGFFFLF